MNSISSEERKPFYGWTVLAVLAACYFIISGALLYSFPVFLPFLCQAFGWSRAFVSLANTASIMIVGLAGPFAGMFIARYGARRAIVVGNIMCALCFASLGFLSRPWQLFFAYGALLGLGASMGGMLPVTTVANNWFVKKRSLALSILFTAGGLGALVLVPVMMQMINRLGWRHTYWMIAAITILFLTILPGLFIRNKPEDLGQAPDGPIRQSKRVTAARAHDLYTTPVDFTAKEAMRTPALWLLTAFASAQMLGLQGILQHQVAFLMDIGLSSTIAANAMGMFAGISIIGRLGIGFLGLRYNIRPLAIGTMLLLIAGMLLTALTKTLAMVFVYSTILGIGMGASLVIVANLYPVYFGKTHYPKIMGYTKPFITIISSLGSPLSGWIRDVTGHYTLAWQISAIIFALGLMFLILARPPVHPTLRKGKEVEPAQMPGSSAKMPAGTD